MHQAIEVSWRTDPGKGYTDVLPVDEFSKEVTGAERLHIVRGPRGGVHQARYRLDVSGSRARLDYTAFREFNVRHGMLNGRMELQFSNPARTHVEQLRWNGKIVKSSQAVVETKMLAVPISTADIVVEQQKALAEQTLRPGQAEFRRTLDLAYGTRCCISGCSVPQVLEAAHLDPVATSGSDDPVNGLLLRRDLHALFGANEMAIEPVSRVVVFSKEAQAWPEYKRWHKSVTLSEPQSGFEAPSHSTLQKRWSAFLQVHRK
ncbi:MAG TPA: HNH endonuclease [Vicinamibacterales bacterium]|nr:HNH endonuclease [Vicinamibacterales bacterium]